MNEINPQEINTSSPPKPIIGQPRNVDVRLACVEDGLDNIGFRKFAAYVKLIHPNTKAAYVPNGNVRGYIKLMSEKSYNVLNEEDIHRIAKFLAEGDLVGLSSMTPYSETVVKIIDKVRVLNPESYIVWGGIHPIIYPEDAIKHADAACTGEGEFAFKTFLDLFKSGKDFTTAPSFWFKKGDKIIKNRNLPLMTPKEMDELPPLMYEDEEIIYHQGEGFKEITKDDYMSYLGLGYNTIWTVGCPLHCTFCGNTKFIEYDNNYRKLRYSSPQTIVNEIKRAISKQPYLSAVAFWDDSFMGMPFVELEKFCKIYKKEIKIPFAVYGVIPTYVREDKIAILLDAGMNRIRMGIQSGSENILEFYKRPTKLKRVKEATHTLNKFKKYMMPPAYDIILENPVETREDTLATIDMIYEMPRPFNLNIFALKVIPNTQLAKDIEGKGIKIPSIQDESYITGYHRTMANVLVFALATIKLPKWLYKILRKKVYPVATKQTQYPILFPLVRIAYLMKRGFDHLRFMDFSILPGKAGYYLWKLGVIKFWHRFVLKRYDLSKNKDVKLPGDLSLKSKIN